MNSQPKIVWVWPSLEAFPKKYWLNKIQHQSFEGHETPFHQNQPLRHRGWCLPSHDGLKMSLPEMDEFNVGDQRRFVAKQAFTHYSQNTKAARKKQLILYKNNKNKKHQKQKATKASCKNSWSSTKDHRTKGSQTPANGQNDQKKIPIIEFVSYGGGTTTISLRADLRKRPPAKGGRRKGESPLWQGGGSRDIAGWRKTLEAKKKTWGWKRPVPKVHGCHYKNISWTQTGSYNRTPLLVIS